MQSFQRVRTVLVRAVGALHEQEVVTQREVHERDEAADDPPGRTVEVMETANRQHEPRNRDHNGNQRTQHADGRTLHHRRDKTQDKGKDEDGGKDGRYATE